MSDRKSTAVPEMQRELYERLVEAERYICDILTGQIMRQAGVEWPDGKPNGPLLQKIRTTLAKARGEQ